MVPVYLKHRYKKHGVFANARSIMAIHNLAYQGAIPAGAFASLGLPGDAYSELEWINTQPDRRDMPVRV
jgi:glycogen synthase